MNAAYLANLGIERWGEYPATFFEGRHYTNVEQLDFACRLATVLKQHGVNSCDRVVVMMSTCTEVPASFQAIWRLGAIIVPIMPQLIAREVSYIVQDSGAELVLTSPQLAPVVAAATAELPHFREILIFGECDVAGTCNIEPEIGAARPHTAIADKDDDDLAVLVYTSGTTGNPKGVMLPHGAIIENTQAVKELFNQSSRSRTLIVLPMSHVYGMMLMNLSVLLGQYVAMTRRFDPTETLRLIQDYKVERMSLAPTMLVYLLNHPERDKYDTSTLKFVTAGSAPLADELRREFSRVFGCRLADGYGQSEATCAVTSYRDDEEIVPGSAGRAIDGVEVCIMDDDMNQLGPNETGEICVRGRNVMKGYWNNPKATAETIINGWLHSGDIGHIDEKGYVYITDRKKDMIIKGGENISPRQIEEAIHKHPAVAECAVFGVPDAQFQEEIAAAVVLKPGQQATAAEIQERVLQDCTKFKNPRFVHFCSELPKNSNGKILKRKLRENWVNDTQVVNT